MFEFSKKFGVNEKLAFRLYPELAAESYTLLVKKVKDNLVAAVISNNDKNSVDLKVNDEIYLFSETEGGKWVTKTLLMQRHSYPLVILSVAGEPWPLKPGLEKNSPAPHGYIESTEHADSSALGVEEEAEPLAVKGDENEDDLASLPGITIRELNAEPERTPGQEGMRLGVEDLDSLPDIDTSELEAELNADIEDTLEKGRVSFASSHDIEDETAVAEPLTSGIEGESEEEDLSDMIIEKGASLAIGSFDEGDVPEPVVEKLVAPEPLKVDIGEPEEEPASREDEDVLYAPETENDIHAAPEVFHDFFTAYLTPVKDGEPPPVRLDSDVSPEIKMALGVLAERIERLEGALSSISASPLAAAPPMVSERVAVVLAGLTEDGFKAVMDEAPMSGERFTVDVDRQWRPPLFLKAVAVVESSFSVNDITLVRFSFEGLDESGRMAVRAYLDGRAGYFKSLTDLVKD